MLFLTQCNMSIDFAVKVSASCEEEAKLIAEILANSSIKNCEIVVITSKGVPVKLLVHNNTGECENAIEIDDEKENHQTSAIA